jgi:hypothetical protein
MKDVKDMKKSFSNGLLEKPARIFFMCFMPFMVNALGVIGSSECLT